MLIQLELFDTPTESEMLRSEMEEVRKSSEKVRKALFARHGELAKKYCELHMRMEILERHLCQGKKYNDK